MPPPITRSTIRRPSDENLVITVIALSLLTSTVLGIGIYQFLQYQHQQDQERLNSRAYRSYVRHTDEEQAQAQSQAPEQTTAPPSFARQPSQAQINQDMTRRLLSHPGVTPGVGFAAPGVRSTGVLIIDAIDQAQAREKGQALQRPPS